jgi:hypothetical protein
MEAKIIAMMSWRINIAYANTIEGHCSNFVDWDPGHCAQPIGIGLRDRPMNRRVAPDW